jgi:hypothetical protein
MKFFKDLLGNTISEPSSIMKFMKMCKVPSQEKKESKSGEEHGSWT